MSASGDCSGMNLPRLCGECLNSAICLSYFNLSVPNASLQARLRVHCRPIDDMAVINGKAGSMPWTLNKVAIKRALGKRSAQVGAGFCQSINLLPAPD